MRASPSASSRSNTKLWSTRPVGRVCCDCSSSVYGARSTSQSACARVLGERARRVGGERLRRLVAHVGLGHAAREAVGRAVGPEADRDLVDVAGLEQPHFPPVRRVDLALRRAARTPPCRRLRARRSSASSPSCVKRTALRASVGREPELRGQRSRLRRSPAARDIVMSRLTSGIASGKSRHATARRDRREQRVGDPERGLAGHRTPRFIGSVRAHARIADHAARSERSDRPSSASASRSRSTCMRVLAEERRRALGDDGVADIRSATPTCGNRAGERMRKVHAHAARDDLRIGEHLVEPVDRPAGHAQRLRAPRATRAACASRSPRRSAAPATSRLRTRSAFFAKRASGAHSRTPGDLAELRELAVVADGEDQVAVGAREHLVGHDVLVRVAGARRRLAGDEVVHVHHRHHRDGRVEQARGRSTGPRRCGRGARAPPGSPPSRTCRS